MLRHRSAMEVHYFYRDDLKKLISIQPAGLEVFLSVRRTRFTLCVTSSFFLQTQWLSDLKLASKCIIIARGVTYHFRTFHHSLKDILKMLVIVFVGCLLGFDTTKLCEKKYYRIHVIHDRHEKKIPLDSIYFFKSLDVRL